MKLPSPAAVGLGGYLADVVIGCVHKKSNPLPMAGCCGAGGKLVL